MIFIENCLTYILLVLDFVNKILLASMCEIHDTKALLLIFMSGRYVLFFSEKQVCKCSNLFSHNKRTKTNISKKMSRVLGYFLNNIIQFYLIKKNDICIPIRRIA